MKAMKKSRNGQFVVLVDDDALVSSFYRDMLEESLGCTVRHFLTPDTLFEFLASEPSVDLFILDVMLPTGRRYSSLDSHDGLTTGALVLRDLRERYAQTPILVLTSSSDGSTLQQLGHNARVCRKAEFSPSEIAKIANTMIGEGNL